MDTVTALWTLALLVALVSVPMAIVRAYVYFSGERDHVRTMRIAMTVSVVIAAVAVASLIGLSIARVGS